MLSDQVDSQCEKIGDLEKLLDDKKEVLKRTEDILQREMINRSALETKKLELMSDLAGLKLRQAAIEKENMELRKKLSKTMQLEASVANADRSGNNTIASSQQHKNFGTMPKNAKPLETHFHVNEPKVCKEILGAKIQIFSQCLKISQKVTFNFNILSGQMLFEHAKNGPFWRVFKT